jgi:hypothetical protein
MLSGVNTIIAGNTFNNTASDLNLTGNERTSTTIYHNNFYTGIIAPENASGWGLGYPGGGNYYDYSNHTDLNGTITQNVPGPDGLVDEPFVFNTSYNDIDGYPLAFPWPVNRLPVVDNFTFDVNSTVKPKAVMFIANGSDIEDAEINLTPIFEYRAPNGTWENASVSFYRFENSTWRANLTHPLNGSKGWYDIKVQFRDTGGYHSNVIYIFKAFNITTEKPVALTLNISSEKVLRTQTFGLQLNGSDPDESEFNLTPHMEVQKLGTNTWQSINYWDLKYELGNFSGNDTGNYTEGFFLLKITPDTKLPAGVYQIRFRFNDTLYDFSDWFYHNRTITVLNNLPIFDDSSVLQPIVKRTQSTLVYANASDIENDISNLSCYMQYRSPGGQWVNFTDEYYNSTLDQWVGSFSPNISYIPGSYDIRVEFRDLDNDSTGWNQTDSAITVQNNEPEILKINITKTSVLRTGFVHIYIDGFDVENFENLLIPVLEYHSPTLPPFTWTAISGMQFIGGSWRGNFTTAIDYTLGLYSFRAMFVDLDGAPTIGWIYQNNSLEVVNNLPTALQLSVSLNSIYRGESVVLTFAGSDIEDANNLLSTEVEFRFFDQGDTDWQPLGSGVYSSANDEWTFEYNAPYTTKVTFYDFRVRFTDADGNSSAWRNLLAELLVLNNLPVINEVTFSHEEIYRLESLTVWINSSDIEDSPDKYFHKELQIRKPGKTVWDSPELQYTVLGNGLLETQIFIELLGDEAFPLGTYDFRVQILDSAFDETEWFESLSAVSVINRPPELLSVAVTPINGTLDTVFNFTVIYQERENEMPATISLRIGINRYTPMQLDPLDEDPFDGVLFFFTTTLRVGVYSFFFTATDEGGGYVESAVWTGLKVENVTIPVEPGKIVGQVTDATTGEGIPQAGVHYSVTKSNFIKITTDPDGVFEIVNLETGTYNIYATASGYEVGAIRELDVVLSKTSVISLKLKREESPDAEEYEIEILSSKLVVSKGENVEVEAGITDSMGNAVVDDKFIYNWDFGDGSEFTIGSMQTHNYTNSGTYNITLTVLDDMGLIDVVKITVTVNETIYIPPDIDPPDNGDGNNNGGEEGFGRLGVLYAALAVSMILVIILAFIVFSMILAKFKGSEKEEGTEDSEDSKGTADSEDEVDLEDPEDSKGTADSEDAVDLEDPDPEDSKGKAETEDAKVQRTTEEPKREATIEEIEEDDDIKIIIKEY